MGIKQMRFIFFWRLYMGKKFIKKSHMYILIGTVVFLAVFAVLLAVYMFNFLNITLKDIEGISNRPEIIDDILRGVGKVLGIVVSIYILLMVMIIGVGIRKYFIEHMQHLEEISISMEETQALMLQQEKLASIGELAAGVAHELNNPIGFVNSNIDALREYIPELEKHIRYLEDKCGPDEGKSPSKDIEFILADIPDLVDESLEGLSRVTSIVKSLKDYARVDLEDRMDYDINDGIEATLTVSRNTYKYVADIDKQLSEVPLLVANGNQINEVLLNLFVNAAQAIEEEQRKEKGTITVRTYADAQYVYCEVIDDGPGISDENIRKIFDPFFTTKEPGKGTGLGLNIAYNTITSKHEGEITVVSNVDKGAKFTIKLPIDRGVKTNESS